MQPKSTNTPTNLEPLIIQSVQLGLRQISTEKRRVIDYLLSPLIDSDRPPCVGGNLFWSALRASARLESEAQASAVTVAIRSAARNGQHVLQERWR